MAHNSFLIRPFDASDAGELFALVAAQGHDLDAFAWRPRIASPKDEAAFIAWAHGAEAAGQALNRAIIVDGALAGSASLYAPHPGAFPDTCAPTLQMGYWVAREFRGQGLAWRAMAMLCQEAASIFPAGSTAGIRSRSANGASRACAAKLGLVLVASGLPSSFDSSDTDVAMVGPLGPPAPQPATARRPRP